MLTSVAPQSSAAGALGAAIDCSNVDINYTDNPEWTQNERLEAMDKAFFDSVNRFELCNLSKKNNTSSTSANGTTQASDTSISSGLNSTASPAMEGTEVETARVPNDSVEENDAHSTSINGMGGKPENIPNTNNDDVIAAQIRRAAEIEPDPVKKKQLWNEYRKYKGGLTQ